jgi:hypothetical protein
LIKSTGLKNTLYIFLFTLLGSAAPASAQMHQDAEPGFEIAASENSNKQKNKNNAEKPATKAKESTTSPTDKRKLTIQIKQGDKWYRLSISLMF